MHKTSVRDENVLLTGELTGKNHCNSSQWTVAFQAPEEERALFFLFF